MKIDTQSDPRLNDLFRDFLFVSNYTPTDIVKVLTWSSGSRLGQDNTKKMLFIATVVKVYTEQKIGKRHLFFDTSKTIQLNVAIDIFLRHHTPIKVQSIILNLDKYFPNA